MRIPRPPPHDRVRRVADFETDFAPHKRQPNNAECHGLPVTDSLPSIALASDHRKRRRSESRGTHSDHDRTSSYHGLRRRRRIPSIFSSTLTHSLGIVLFAFLLFAQSASAVSVEFENCLPNWYREAHDPTLIQWVPHHVEAAFDPVRDDHILMVAMYGDVKGIYSSVNTSRPDPNDKEYWTNPNKTEWKIPSVHDPLGPNPRFATLSSKINVLTYEPYTSHNNFCEQSLRNGTCPLGPTFKDPSTTPYYEFPSVAITTAMNSSYAFASFATTFLVKYGDANITQIGCVSVTVTPDLGNLTWLLKFLPLLILLVVGGSVIYASIWSQWGSLDVFQWSSNYGRDPLLLRLVTPGFGDCLYYIQFICLTAGLTLNYPGFYQPIASQGGWAALMFNHSIVSSDKDKAYSPVRDGIYVTSGRYGMSRLAQLVGMGESEDIWAGMMVWLLVIIGGTLVLTQIGFAIQWLYRYVRSIPEEDLRAKNLPFTIGNVVRIVFNYFLLPIVSLSTFQIVVAGEAASYIVAMAGLSIAVIIIFASWLLFLIITTRPRAVLFDDLPTLLIYGPLYNTYSDEGAFFALVPILLSFIRGIAIGAVQPSGIAQVILLAICEVIQLLTMHAFRPYPPQSSMNAFHILVSSLRLATVLLMIAFIPALGVTEGPRGWVGYAILVIHAGVLVLAFFLLSLKTIAEVTAHLSGAGGFDVTGQTRGGLSKIFGVRQLSRRVARRGAGASSRQSQLSSAAMIDAEDASKGGSGYIMPGGRLRSESAGSMGVLLNNRGQRSSSALGSIDFALATTPAAGRGQHPFDSGASSAWTPTTPGEASQFSFLPQSPALQRKTSATMALEASDPYYRPPRRTRRATGTGAAEREAASTPAERTRRSWVSADWSSRRQSRAGGSINFRPGTSGGDNNLGVEPDIERGATPGPYAQQPAADLTAGNLAPRADYSTREVDFYYGVRGQRLNSDAPTRKLGTGPADPTGPIASAAGWWRTMMGGGKSKEKGKGFEVVRSSRMPPGMMMAGASGSRGKGQGEDQGPPEGVPVAMGVLRNGPIESDDEDDRAKAGQRKKGSADLLDDEGNPQEDYGNGSDDRSVSHGVGLAISDAPPMLGEIDAGGSIHLPSRIQSTASRRPGLHAAPAAPSDGAAYGDELMPDVPRKSSRRHSNTPDHSRLPSVDPPQLHSQYLAPSGGSSRLPFQRSDSQKRLSSASSSFQMPDNISDDLLTHEEQAQLPRGRNVSPPQQHHPPQAHHNHPYQQHSFGGAELHRPTSFGHVHTGSVERVDRHPVDLLGREVEVEVVDEVSPVSTPGVERRDSGRLR